VKLRLLFVLLFVALLAPARAQEDQPVHMRPEFPLAFPLTSQGRMVTVKYPVMINQVTEIKPGMQLRVCYTLNSQNPGDQALIHSGSLENTYARDANGSNKLAGVSPEIAHELVGYQRTVWEVPNNFVLFLAQYPTESAHLMYSPTAQDTNLHDEVFNFFDGLFVGLPNGKVTVIAVEKESAAEKAGIKAGDVIVSVGAYSTKDDLMTFANAYSAGKKDANEAGASSYAMVLRGADGTTRTASVALPMRIHGGLMDGFNDKP
jgi:membrane-associated protease RseP (regulator of RpoE activity)